MRVAPCRTMQGWSDCPISRMLLDGARPDQWRRVPETGRMVGSTTHRSLLPHTLAVLCSCRPAAQFACPSPPLRRTAGKPHPATGEANRFEASLAHACACPCLFAPAAAAPTQDVVAPWTSWCPCPRLPEDRLVGQTCQRRRARLGPRGT